MPDLDSGASQDHHVPAPAGLARPPALQSCGRELGSATPSWHLIWSREEAGDGLVPASALTGVPNKGRGTENCPGEQITHRGSACAGWATGHARWQTVKVTEEPLPEVILGAASTMACQPDTCRPPQPWPFAVSPQTTDETSPGSACPWSLLWSPEPGSFQNQQCTQRCRR